MKIKLALGVVFLAAGIGVVFAAQNDKELPFSSPGSSAESSLDQFNRRIDKAAAKGRQTAAVEPIGADFTPVDIVYTPVPKNAPAIPPPPPHDQSRVAGRESRGDSLATGDRRPATDEAATEPSDKFQYAKRFAELTSTNNSLSKQNVALRIQIDRLKTETEKHRLASETARFQQAKLKKKIGELSNALSKSIRKFETTELQRIHSRLSSISRDHAYALSAKNEAEKKLASAEAKAAELSGRLQKISAEWTRLKSQHQTVAQVSADLEKRVDSLRGKNNKLRTNIRSLGKTRARGARKIRRLHGAVKNTHAESRQARQALQTAQKEISESRGRESFLKEKIDKMDAGWRRTAERLRDFKAANGKLQGQVSLLISNNERLSAETASLKKETEAMEAVVKRRDEAMTNRMVELESVKEELSKLRRESEEEKSRLTSRLEQTEGRLAGAIGDRDGAVHANTALQKELQDAKAGEAAARLKTEETAAQLERTDKALSAVQETNRELARRLTELKAEKVQIENQLSAVYASKTRVDAELHSHKQALAEFQSRFDEINQVNRQLLETIQGILKDTKNQID